MRFYDIELKSLLKIKYVKGIATENFSPIISRDDHRLELSFAEKGDFVFSSKKNGATVCESGRLYAFLKDFEGEFYSENDSLIKVYNIHLDVDYDYTLRDSRTMTPDEARKLMTDGLDGNRLLFPLDGIDEEQFDWVSSTIKKIISCNVGERVGEESRALGLLYELFGRINKNSMGLIISDLTAFSTTAIAYSEMVVSYILKNYRKKINVQDLANEFGLSVNYLHSIFKEVKGCTIIDYLTSYRMKLAKDYIETFGLKAYEAASLVGIDDPAYFSRLFKKMYNQNVLSVKSTKEKTQKTKKSK